MYSFGRKSGLPLQPRFRTVRHVQKGRLASFLELVGTSHIDSNVILIGFSVTCCCSCYDHFDDRCVAWWGAGDKESFARLEMEKDGTHVGFWLGPSLIDGSFQASMALADAATGIGAFAHNESSGS